MPLPEPIEISGGGQVEPGGPLENELGVTVEAGASC
jgi:hypothetical protein